LFFVYLYFVYSDTLPACFSFFFRLVYFGCFNLPACFSVFLFCVVSPSPKVVRCHCSPLALTSCQRVGERPALREKKEKRTLGRAKEVRETRTLIARRFFRFSFFSRLRFAGFARCGFCLKQNPQAYCLYQTNVCLRLYVTHFF